MVTSSLGLGKKNIHTLKADLATASVCASPESISGNVPLFLASGTISALSQPQPL